MELLMDPSIWAGLITLIILEIILGIDNLVFIAILADKLPPHQRDKARVIGLSLALIMRLALLSIISWLVTLTQPLFSLGGFSFSGRDLILLLGGIFLLFKATTELHERLESKPYHSGKKSYASFWMVVVQIIVLDAVFSLDAVITAVGMVDQLAVMMAAVVVAMAIMLMASKPLTNFVNKHTTVVVLCLSFLLMIGLSLIAEGFGFHIPKGYLYAAIGFSIVIEIFNQIARRNFLKNESSVPRRVRAAEAIERLMGRGENADDKGDNHTTSEDLFVEEEHDMIKGVLTFSSRSLRSIMTPRNEISWVNCQLTAAEMKMQLLACPHSLLPVCDGELDNIIGVVRAKSLLVALDNGDDIVALANASPAVVVPETLDTINLLNVLRKAYGNLVMVTNEFGDLLGLVTPLDVLETIAGEFPDADETPEIIEQDNSWLVKGNTAIHSLQRHIDIDFSKIIAAEHKGVVTIAGLLSSINGAIPKKGELIDLHPLQIAILEADDYRIDLIRITMNEQPA